MRKILRKEYFRVWPEWFGSFIAQSESRKVRSMPVSGALDSICLPN